MRNHSIHGRNPWFSTWLFICAVAVSLSAVSVVAHTSEGPKFSDDYYGRAVDGSGILDIATSQLQVGLQQYYAVYGEWPTAWQDVIDVGIFQVQLRGYQMQVIDPDDGELDFNGDLAYDPAVRADGSVVVQQILDVNGVVTKQTEVQPPATYAEVYPALQQLATWEDLSVQFEDEKWLRQFAILGMINQGIFIYRKLYGEYPAELADLLRSGLSPIDFDSINPLTGVPYNFDASELDIYYERCGDDHFKLLHVKENGELPAVKFTY